MASSAVDLPIMQFFGSLLQEFPVMIGMSEIWDENETASGSFTTRED